MQKRSELQDYYRNAAGIERIVRDGLCLRCGACAGVCPAATFTLDPEGYPHQTNPCLECNLCVEVCPGLGVDYQSLGEMVFGEDYRYGPPMGNLRWAAVGCARDPIVRRAGASGGVVTQILLHLLETGRIRAAVVTIPHPSDPARSMGTVARTREEIIRAAQSQYTSSPTLAVLDQIAPDEGPIAVVGLPCHIHALRRAQQLNPARWNKFTPLIGLFCHFNLPRAATEELASVVTPPGASLKKITYRAKDDKGWPFNTHLITFTDGSRWKAPLYAGEMVTLLGAVHPIQRCSLCLDALAEFADIAVGDPWIRDADGNLKYSAPEGFSSIIVRTALGEEILRRAGEDGWLSYQEIDPAEIEDGQRSMIYEKKLSVPARLAVLGALHRPLPTYNAPLPRPGFTRIAGACLFLASQIIVRWKPIRIVMFRIAFSRVGRFLIRHHRRRKLKRVRRRAAASRRAS